MAHSARAPAGPAGDVFGYRDVIQAALFFILGFLCASFLALMVAPAIWRRAVALTRRRIEASVPLTMDEIQADKDRLRAEFAMTTRRLEMNVQSFREKNAGQTVEINRNREELKRIAQERDERNRAVAELEAQAEKLRNELRLREEEAARQAGRLADAEQRLEARALELEQMGRMYDEASFAASSRQIDLVAQESKLEKMSEEVAALRSQRKEADARVREIEAELREAREALRAERKRSSTLEKKNERLASSLADRDDRLERRERELARFRDQVKDNGTGELRIAAELEREQEARARLEDEGRELAAQVESLTSEIGELRAELEQSRGVSSEGPMQEPRGSALLREQITDLAAEVVALTARLEGPDSPINAALTADDGERTGMSLADRVRALQKASASSH